MNRLFLQSLFILLLTGLFGSNALARIHGETPLANQPGHMEQVLEAEGEPADESFGPEDFSGSGFDDDEVQEYHSCPHQPNTGLFPASTLLQCAVAAIRQSQVNLLNSFQAPAMFILFHSYQGYLS